MGGDGLFDPIGRERDDVPLRRTPSPVLVVAGAAVVVLTLLIIVAAWRDDGDRGQPRATSTIEHVAAPQASVAPPASAPVAAAAAPTTISPPPSTAPRADTSVPTIASGLPPVRDDQEVEVQNGVRIIRPRRDHPSTGGLRVTVPAAAVR